MVKIALLVGVSHYDSDLVPLPCAVKDVEALKAVLEDSERGAFDSVKTLIDPDRQSMEQEIESLLADREKDDLALLFFSGHGIKDDRGRLYFATHITRKTESGELVKSTAVPASFVLDIMSNSRCKRQVVILDCCFSGAFAEGMTAKADRSIDVRTQLGGQGRAVLTSSSAIQYSFEESASDLSIYTRYLVEGIRTGVADLDGDGVVAIDELHDYAHQKVRETAPAMKPKIFVAEEGFRIFLAKAPIDDPQQRYRREVSQFASGGTISEVGRLVLNALREQLNLSVEVTQQIEAEVLEPYRRYQHNLEQYEQTFEKTVRSEFPLSETTQRELTRFREVLGLRLEDVAEIERRLTPQAETPVPPSPKRYKRYPEPVPTPSVSPSFRRRWLVGLGVVGLVVGVSIVWSQFPPTIPPNGEPSPPPTPAYTNEESLGWIFLGTIDRNAELSTGMALQQGTQASITIEPPRVPHIGDTVTVTQNSLNVRGNYPQPPDYAPQEWKDTLNNGDRVVVLELKDFIEPNSAVPHKVWARVKRFSS